MICGDSFDDGAGVAMSSKLAAMKNWLGILALAAVVCTSPARGQEDAPVAEAQKAEKISPKDEARAFKEAVKPFKDGLFDVTEARLGVFLEQFPEGELALQANLLRGRCAYYLGHYQQAAEYFSLALAEMPSPTPDKPENGPRDAEELALLREALFWQGETWLALGEWEKAGKAFEAFDVSFDLKPPGGVVERVIGSLSNALSTINPLSKEPLETRENGKLRHARALFAAGQTEEAEKLLATLKPAADSDLAHQAALLRARHALASGKSEEARKQLEELSAAGPKPPVRYETAYLLGELLARGGEHEAALKQFDIVTGSETAYPRTIVAEAWFARGNSLAATQKPDEAMVAFEQVYLRSQNQALKLAAFRRYLELAREKAQLAEAVERLRTFVRDNQEQPNAAAALYAISRALADNDETEQAIGNLEALLTAYPGGSWTRPAQFLLGELHRKRGDYPAARQALLASRSGDGSDLLSRQADFQLGQMAYGRRNYSDAAAAFRRASRGNDALAEDALMNLQLSYSQSDDLAKLRESATILRQQFPQSAYLPRLPLLEGTVLERQGKLEEAESVYAMALAAMPKSADQKKKPGENVRAELLIRQAELLEARGASRQATKLYEEFAKQLPNAPEVVDAKRRSILAAKASGRISPQEAIKRLKALQAAHPKDPLAPRIAMHVGEHYHAAGDYVSAQNQFLKIASDYPDHSLSDAARFSAGLAAAAHGDYDDAVAILEKVRSESPLKTDARLLQGKIYHRQLRFQDALTIFDSLLKSVDDGPLFAEALLRRGHCLFAMAERDPVQYELAAAAYGQLIDSGQGDAAQRNEAGFRRARAFEKLGRPEEALALYMEVAQNGMVTETGGEVSNPESIPVVLDETEILWRTKAGLEAGRLLQAREDWRGALRVYRKLEAMGGPGASQLKSLINRIRRDHYIFD